MINNGVDLILATGGIIGSLGGTIIIVYKVASANIQSKFNETKAMVAEQTKALKTELNDIDEHVQKIYGELKTQNSRVTKLETSLSDHKDADKDIHDQERRENERRFIEQMKDHEDLKREVRGS